MSPHREHADRSVRAERDRRCDQARADRGQGRVAEGVKIRNERERRDEIRIDEMAHAFCVAFSDAPSVKPR